MINYLIDKFFYSKNTELNNIFGIKKQTVILLGDGFFARGFMRYINNNNFHIIQIYKDEFINPQDIMYDLQHNNLFNNLFNNPIHFRDFFTKPADVKIKTTINNLDITTPNKVKINNEYYKYNYLVVGLGANKSLYDWRNELQSHSKNNLSSKNYLSSNNIISIIGMGPSGIELSCILSKYKNIYLFDTLSKETIFKNKENLFNILENKNIKMMFETKYNNSYSKDFIFCGGTKTNILTNNYKPNNYLQINENIYIGGDCNYNNNIKTAQNAYQQGVYVAKRLNGEIEGEYKYNHNGNSLNIGDNKVLIENHSFIPDGIYPDFIIKIYSFFLI